jgi:hypothetical protein
VVVYLGVVDYHPSDFLMFSPRIYWRLFESINAAYGPPAWTLVAARVAVARAADASRAPRRKRCRRCIRHAAAARAARRVLSVRRLGIPARAVRADQTGRPGTSRRCSFCEAALLGALAASNGCARAPHQVAADRRPRAHAVGAAGSPVAAFAFGRPWRQGEVFGLAPDPTAIATLGLLAAHRSARSQECTSTAACRCFVPIAWCAVSAATIATLGSVQAWIVLAVRDRRAAVSAIGTQPTFRA